MIEWKDNQLKAITEQGNLLVAASAGSGKTTVMIERIMRLIKEGASMRRLLVITFTKAAAADMRDKIVDKLYKLMQLQPCSAYKKQIEELPFAAICTIDSFCYDIYRRFFAEAKLEPGLRVLDSEEAGMLFSKAVEETIEELLQENDPDFIALLDRLTHKRNIEKLKAEVININIKLSNLLNKDNFLSTSLEKFEERAKDYFVQHYKKMFAYLKEEAEAMTLASKGLLLKNKLAEHVLYLLERAASAASLNDFGGYSEYGFDCKFERTPSHKKTEEENEFIEAFMSPLKNKLKDTYAEVASTLNAYAMETAQDKQLLSTFIKLTVAAEHKYKQKKYAQGCMDFSDLSIYASQILQDSQIAAQIADQYDYIFVDEYQDTSVLQELIIHNLQRADNLFTVGDIKQSIYGFRNAEPTIFINRRKLYENREIGKNIPMNDNFRSTKGILDFANAFFSPIMSEEFGGVDYANDAKLQPGITIEESDALPACQVTLFSPKPKTDKELPKVYSVAEDDFSIGEEDNREAIFVAEKISSIVGKEYIYDTKEKVKRLIKYSDIAILMRNRKDQGLFDALKLYNIPFLSFGFREEKYPELDTLVNYLRLLDNFNNDIALAGVMQSFLGGFTHNEMLAIRKAGKKYHYFYECVQNYPFNDAVKVKIDKLMCDIAFYKVRSYVKNIADLLFEVMGDSGFDAYIMSKERGSLEIAFINTFIFNLTQKEFVNSIPGFLRYYDDIFSKELSYCADKTEAISIMTSHGSKGLEFPVVFIMHFEQGYSDSIDSRQNIRFDKEFGITIKLFDLDTLERSESFREKMIKIKSTVQGRQEELRIAYVAVTRAKNHLFITGKDVPVNKSFDRMRNPAEWLKYSAQTNKSLQDLIHISSEPILPEIEKAAAAITGSVIPDLKGLDMQYSFLEATQMPQKYSVSKLNAYEQADFASNPIALPFDKEVGTAYHKVLEHIDFGATTAPQIEQSLSKMQKEGLIASDLLAEIDFLKIQKMLTSKLWDKVRKGEKVFREWGFMLYLPNKEVLEGSVSQDKVLVQGVCDLVVLGKENFIIDYKVSNLDTQSIANKYRKQLQLYALAVEKIKKVIIKKKIIYIINRNEAVCID